MNYFGKRIVAVLFLTLSSAQANDLAQSWKEFSKYRVVSGIKGAVAVIAALHAGHHSWQAGKLAFHKISDSTDNRSVLSWDRGNEILGYSVVSLSLAYTTKVLLWDYLPDYARHALKL